MTVSGNSGRLYSLGKLIVYAMLAYNVVVLALLVLREIFGEQWAVIAYANHGVLWLLLLALPGAVICPLVLKWRGLIAVLPAVVFLMVYIPQFIPKSQTEGDFSVATYNITGWLDTPQKLELVRALNVDILGMEEAYDPVRLRQQMADLYPYGFTQVQDNTNEIRYEHLALFSRYPIDEESVTYIGENQSVTRPIAMRLVVDIDGQPVSVYVAHAVRPDVNPLTFSNELRHNGILSLVEAIRADPNPVIVLCDCNMSEWTTDYSLMSGVLTDSWRERGVGFGLSVPATQTRAPFPLMRSDYIWHSDNFTAPAVKLWDDSSGSEHFPVRAEISFSQP